MTDYITAQSFMARHGITTLTNAARINEHITAASRKVDAFTHRQFGPHTGAATARFFTPASCLRVYIDDAYEITSVEVDADDNGTYSTTWYSEAQTATPDYETDPAAGIGSNGQPGWPTWQIRAVADERFPLRTRRRAVRVTAKWGWEAIPADVAEATHLYAHRLHYEVAVPSGWNVSGAEFGMPGTPLARPYTAEGLLRPYVRADRMPLA